MCVLKHIRRLFCFYLLGCVCLPAGRSYDPETSLGKILWLTPARPGTSTPSQHIAMVPLTAEHVLPASRLL